MGGCSWDVLYERSNILNDLKKINWKEKSVACHWDFSVGCFLEHPQRIAHFIKWVEFPLK